MVGSTAVLDEGLHAGQAKQTGPEDVCAEEGPYPAQPCGAAQQPPDGVFDQVEEQAFGQPHGATGFVETCVLECRLPPPAEISTDLPALAWTPAPTGSTCPRTRWCSSWTTPTSSRPRTLCSRTSTPDASAEQ